MLGQHARAEDIGREIEAMRDRKKILLPVALLVAAALALPAARAFAQKGREIEQAIADAKTAADHESIAAFYEGEAKSAEKKADSHDRMAANYKKAGGGVIEKLHLDQHCADIAKRFREVAKDARDLAAAHRQMAKDAQ